MKQLKQKNWSEKRNFDILSDGLKVEINTNESFNEEKISFDDIGFDEIVIKHTPSIILVGFYISVLLNIFLAIIIYSYNFPLKDAFFLKPILILFFSIAFFWGYKIFKFEKTKTIRGNFDITFWYFSKNKKEVDVFIAKLKDERMKYYRDIFLELDEFEPPDILIQRLNWLKSQEYISKQELKEYLTVINNRKLMKGM
ncbi:hypothetical protein [Lacihabitans soyangensis]|uniref:Uncharacterized protein n=1 Tax=Lacihabitans soyangensis TaxID=869394 RepID=A0AAE3KWG2_9BACT|nr:hypothetical protein [Lacihabitans soyangensis]MCP9762835.1 hypothetical protein [Lacihabitans soyangensis]